MRNLILATLLICLTGCVTVPAGSVGVWTSWGATQEGVFAEGTYAMNPLASDMWIMDSRIKKKETDAQASSKDLQVITTGVALNYRIDSTKADVIFKDIGTLDYVEANIIEPALQEAIKTATASYTAEELITSRALVKKDMTDYITEKLAENNIFVIDLSITNFSFQPAFQHAIEEKQIAEQSALQATNDLARIRIEAEQHVVAAQADADAKVAMAQAEAEAQRLLRRELTPELIQFQAVQKWDGVMPQYFGGDEMPMIMVK